MDAPDICSPGIHMTYNETEDPDNAEVREDIDQDGNQEERKTNSILSRIKYTVLLAEHPYAVFFGTLLVIVICALCSFVPAFGAPRFPDFSKPVMGFESRGTTINKRWRTRFLFNQAMYDGLLFTAPPRQEMLRDVRPLDHAPINKNQRRTKKDTNRRSPRNKMNNSLTMCDGTENFMKVAINFKTVFAPKTSGDSLMRVNSLKAMCRLEGKILRDFPGFSSGCYTRNASHYGGEVISECCPSWSVGNYIATLTDRPTCQDIQDSDVDYVMGILRKCFALFQNGALKPNCWDLQNNSPSSSCNAVPTDCARYNAVHNILYYLTDKAFLNDEGTDLLRYSLILTPRNADKEFVVDVYDKYLKNGELSEGDVKLVGTDFDRLKFTMFNDLLLADIIYPSIAMIIILVILWFYTESVLLTFLLLLSVVSALIIAYFIYMVAFSLKFFPFLNVTTLIFLVGIGADDAFVFTDVWRQAKINNPGACLAKITTETFKHASMSMFVTSFTTAAAFIANFSSQITTIKLFGLYAGIAVLCKFSMMITWFPALCIINEKWCAMRPTCFARSDAQTTKKTCAGFLNSCYRKTLRSLARYTFDSLLPGLVIKFRYLWVLLFLILTLCGLIVLTVKPGFQLPTSSDFQMFASSHPLESYDLHLKKKFRFEVSSSQESGAFPIDIFWGIKAVDTGDFLNPIDHGDIEWDETFDVVNPESQRWLMAFCQRLRRQKFVRAQKADLEQACFLETFYNQSCTAPELPRLSLYPCCKNSSFPFNKTVLDVCSSHKQALLSHKQQTSAFVYDFMGNIKGLHIRVQSNERVSRAYHPQRQFWERVESWVNKEMADAPVGMRRGWFISDVEFYNLQKSLSRGMLVSLGISIAMAFVVMLLTTLNILVSIYAILTIIGIISVTIGSLVLSGWKLNILESVTMSVAVGVSVDFAMHFGVAYCLAPNKSCRQARVVFSISRMGSAITMAAVTTFIAGSMMMPSAVLSYIQMGHFLMLVMAVSWAFSTFFFQSLCSIAGPQGDWGQLSWAQMKQFCCNCSQTEVEKSGDVSNLEPQPQPEANELNQGRKANKDVECHEEPLLYTTGV